MIITYLRSSSYNQFGLCPHSYFLTYVLGLPNPSGLAAAKGTIVHKALEVMAWVGIANRKGQGEYEDDAFGRVVVEDATPDWAIERAFEYYSAREDHLTFHKYDLRDCREWMKMALEFNDGMYDPRNLDVIAPEQRFDFQIPADWAHYKYDTPDGVIEGQFGLKGTVDLVVRDKHDPTMIEIVDWKTGSRKPFDKDTKEMKSYEDFQVDPQLCMYHYAISHIFPEAEHIEITIFYIRYGGPFRMCFGKDDLIRTEEVLRRKFDEIRATERPKLVKTWRCTKTCYFGKTQSPLNPSKTICQYMADEVARDGIEATMAQHGKSQAYMRYGSGGGRKDSE